MTLYKSNFHLAMASTLLIFICICSAREVCATEKENMMKDKTVKSDTEWKQTLSPDQYKILRNKETEQAFTGKYWNHHETGSYICAGCGTELFKSQDKFDSSCGWPSFRSPAENENVNEQPDNSLGMNRTEITCSACGGHLGHVFNDGPKPTGLRYCINSASLQFLSTSAKNTDSSSNNLQIATLGTGCFWCSEALFENLPGVKSVKAGYMGGKTENPSYEQVCSGKTGHAEVAQIIYDPAKISYRQILDFFWQIHDPTTLNRQGDDVGIQYRSVIFYHNEEQKKIAEATLNELKASRKFNDPIVTEITSALKFYQAEDYHQNYYRNNSNAPYCRMVIAPKLKKFSNTRP